MALSQSINQSINLFQTLGLVSVELILYILSKTLIVKITFKVKYRQKKTFIINLQG